MSGPRIALLLAMLGAVGASVEARCPSEKGYPEIVVTRGGDACATADVEQTAEIEARITAVGRAEGLAILTVDYPLDETIFPPEMHPPTFLWHDAEATSGEWLLQFRFATDDSSLALVVPGDPPPQGEIDPECISVTNEVYQPTEYQASARSWRPSSELWALVQSKSVDRPARLSLSGFVEGETKRPVSRGELVFRTSSDPVGAPIFYRDVPLMPSSTQDGVIKPLDKSAQPLIAWRLRDISRPESRVMLKRMPTCANCHSFSADGGTLGMDVDGPNGDKGAYAIAEVKRDSVIRDENVITWNAYEPKPRGQNTLGFMSRVSPDGSHVVSTVNEQIYVRNFWDYRFSQVFFPTRGILAYYSRESGEIHALPGADDPNYVHCNAVWTPDGKSLVFARAPAKDPYEPGRPMATYAGDPNETQIRYDLYRIPFHEGRGGSPVPIVGASNNGMSNSFPKISPDGRFLVWVQSKNGLLMRPDSKLWIVPLSGGTPRLMRANTTRMNSWHSFSPNGRWMVFSSKQNRPYTQMFLTHIDKNGMDSPPVLIENSTAANRAANLPEFVNVAYDEFASIHVPAVDHYEHFGRGNELARAGRYDEAAAELEKALEGEIREWRRNDWRIHESLSKVLLRLGDNRRALEHIQASLEINPFNAELHANAAIILFGAGNSEQALQQIDLALRLTPQDPQLWFNRGTMRLELGDSAAAIEDYTEAVRLNPKYADAYSARGILLRDGGKIDEALADFDRVVEMNPNNPTALYFRALIHRDTGDPAAAVRDLDAALDVAPPNWERREELVLLREEIVRGLAKD